MNLRDVIKTAISAGADRISIADTLGILTPEKDGTGIQYLQ